MSKGASHAPGKFRGRRPALEEPPISVTGRERDGCRAGQFLDRRTAPCSRALPPNPPSPRAGPRKATASALACRLPSFWSYFRKTPLGFLSRMWLFIGIINTHLKAKKKERTKGQRHVTRSLAPSAGSVAVWGGRGGVGEGQAPLPSAGHIRLGVMLGTGPGFPLGAEPTTAHGLAGRGALDGAAGLRELRPDGRSARSASHAKPLRGPVKPKGPQGKPNAGQTGLRFPAALPRLTSQTGPRRRPPGKPWGREF